MLCSGKMFKPHLNPPENSLKPNNFNFKAYPQKANGISFWAFLLSTFIYISIFYIFNLSPSSALTTTKFWFFLSNTLILIIAADFGAFSSSKNQPDLYEEYVKSTRASGFPSLESQYQEIVHPPREPENPRESESQERIKEVVVVHESKNPENNILHIVANDDLNKLQEELQDNKIETGNENNEEGKKTEARCARSMSEKPISMADDENKIVLRRTVSESHHPQEDNEDEDEEGEGDGEEEEENEFSAMTNEELNRRVEEFIRRFNRQIRIQAVQNRIRET